MPFRIYRKRIAQPRNSKEIQAYPTSNLVVDLLKPLQPVADQPAAGASTSTRTTNPILARRHRSL
jgi:hypothetical protein